jgi:hypothetical protein
MKKHPLMPVIDLYRALTGRKSDVNAQYKRLFREN